MRLALPLFLAVLRACFAETVELSDNQALEIGRRIWKNECGGTVSGLTSWNAGEEFASLGIAHFIWYPEGKSGPFEESFPRLVAYLGSHGTQVPGWMGGPCPWKTRTSFMADVRSSRMQALRELLVATIALQARFAALRLERALPKMIAAAPVSKRETVRDNFSCLSRTPRAVRAYGLREFQGRGCQSGRTLPR